MKNRPGKRTVGLLAMAWQEIANRWTEGVLRYLEDERGLTLRDFRFQKAFDIDDVSPPPQPGDRRGRGKASAARRGREHRSDGAQQTGRAPRARAERTGLSVRPPEAGRTP